MDISINSKHQLFVNCSTNGELRCFLQRELGLQPNEYYLLCNGKLVGEKSDLEFKRIDIILRVSGGKGGFGSMLRAIGAQIEKTTNREACRDLSGRRLRDINEEQRLKNWINQQAEREKEAKEKKQKKLERLCETPRHEFKDEQYDKERSELPEVVEDAVTRGLQASCSSKRKVADKNPVVKKKKAKLWVDDDLDDDLSSSDGESDDNHSEENKNSSNDQKNADSENSGDGKTINSGANTEKPHNSTDDQPNNKTVENNENVGAKNEEECETAEEKLETQKIEGHVTDEKAKDE